MGEPGIDELRVLLISSRPMVHALVSNLAHSSEQRIIVSRIAGPTDDLSDLLLWSSAQTVAVVDGARETTATVRVCRALRDHRPDLPILVLLCCTATPRYVQELLAAGVHSLLDWQATTQDVFDVLRSLARGDAVLRVQFGEAGARSPAPAEGAEWPHSPPGAPRLSPFAMHILGLVASGLSDRQIGRHVYLSQHTVRHHLERLRSEVGARNRTELAAWAGRHGFYGPLALDRQLRRSANGGLAE